MDKNIALAITYMYPNLKPFVDFKVVSENGIQSISDWNTTEIKPTQDQLDTAWNNYLTSINSIDILKQMKIDELDQACKNAIIGQFTAQVNGVTYSFSNDTVAQSNFKDAKDAWTHGYISNTQTIKWTAYDVNGNVVRLDLNETDFDPVNIARMTWQQSNVAKFRDKLEPQVNSATSVYELNQIIWN